MCGIVGIATRSPDPALEARVSSAVGTLEHRGPDACAVETIDGGSMRCVVGHTRLRILDLSAAADQPLYGEDGTVGVVYNGELYGEPELRRDLVARGHRFATATDTEALVHLYEEHRDDPLKMLPALRGMFAFAIVDRKRGQLFLARDRLGIKPMYWAPSGGGVAFASEIRALTAAGFVDDELDPGAVGDFLFWGHTRIDRMFVSAARELPPGHALLWTADDASPKIRRWWSPDPVPHQAVGEEAQRLVRAALDDAVRRHLIADRPVGVFLSGGIDSGAIAARAAAAGDVRTFTVTFPEASSDEGPSARQLAARLGVSHDEVPVTGAEIADAMPRIVSAMDRPTVDGVNTWIIAGAAVDAGLVVALSGLGGDELFGGYPSFTTVPNVERLDRVLARIGEGPRRAAATLLAGRFPGGRASRVLASRGGFAGAYASVRGHFSAAELRAAGIVSSLTPVRGDRPDLSAGDRVMLLEMANYLPEQLLRDTDQMSMAHSLEVRVPLLDDVLVDVAMSLPASVRMRTGKRLLASAGGVAMVSKKPFALPFDLWMRGPLRGYVREALLSSALPFADEIPARFRRSLWDSFEARRTHWSRPWSVAVLRLWAAQRNGAG